MAKGCRGRLNRTHASFLNSLAGPKKKKKGGGARLGCKPDSECHCQRRKIAQFITILQDARTQAHRYKGKGKEKKGGGGVICTNFGHL